MDAHASPITPLPIPSGVSISKSWPSRAVHHGSSTDWSHLLQQMALPMQHLHPLYYQTHLLFAELVDLPGCYFDRVEIHKRSNGLELVLWQADHRERTQTDFHCDSAAAAGALLAALSGLPSPLSPSLD